MRPVRLQLTAFGPYAGTEVVDFESLADLGLFVVAGKNGSGKTTIFDALHYGLFGTLPGRRSGYVRLKSDHADDTAHCEVVLDFAAKGRLWRVERSPKQKRRKRRGKGLTTIEHRATLYRLDQGIAGPPTAVANKIGEVDEHCRTLVGLSGRQFERVALLPQGEFSRVLTESGTDRRELLRTLFSSEIFGDATSLLADEAAAASGAEQASRLQLQARLERLAGELAMSGAAAPAVEAESIARTLDEQRRTLTSREAEAAHLAKAATAAASALHDGIATRQRMDERERLRRRLHEHEADRAQHERDLARIAAGRAAVPVAANERSLQGHLRNLNDAQRRVDELHEQLAPVLVTLDMAAQPASADHDQDLASNIQELVATLDRRRALDARLRDVQATLQRVQGDQRRCANEGRTIDERLEQTGSQRRRVVAELEHLADHPDLERCEADLRSADALLARRVELADVDESQTRAARAAADLDLQIERLERDHEHARAAELEHVALQQRASTALDAHEEALQNHDAAVRFQHAGGVLVDRRAELARARDTADRLWDRFIAGSAARLAETLAESSPCPVCGSCSHPAPATHIDDSTPVTDGQVRAARDAAQEIHDHVRSLETELERLVSDRGDVVSQPISELAAHVTTSKAMAIAAGVAADECRSTADRRESLATSLDTARRRRQDLDTELRAIEQRHSRLSGALGDAAHESVAALTARFQRATTVRDAAEGLDSRRRDLHDQRACLDELTESLHIDRLSAQSRHSALGERIADHQSEADLARREVAALDNELGFDDFEHRAAAARRALELLSRLRDAAGRADEATQAVRRAQSILDERLAQSPFDSIAAATAAHLEPHVLEQLEAHTSAHQARGQHVQGQLAALGELPDEPPHLEHLRAAADTAAQVHSAAERSVAAATARLDDHTRELTAIVAEQTRLQTGDDTTKRLERVAAIVRGDNDRNTSLENWVLAAHLRDVVELANVRLAGSTHQRFQLCVLDDGENKRGRWGLDLGVEDTVTGTRRPTAGLSGGELFHASLALALGLADAVMNQSAGVQIDALFIDEGFGSLDETSVERAVDLLDELRDRGAMVGVITHVPALLDALPLGVDVIESADGTGSTIRQRHLAA